MWCHDRAWALHWAPLPLDRLLLPQPVPHPLHAVGWSERVQALFGSRLTADRQPARVVGVARGWCHLVTVGGERSLPVPGTAVGDWVVVEGDTVAEVLPRWSTLGRLDPDGGPQVLAANVDIVLVAAPADRLSSARVERELVIAWDSGARPVVVVTKLDLAPPGAVEDLAARLGPVQLIASSSRAGDGLDEVRALLVHPVTAALLGPSGAGKSTLINALLGEERLAVGEVRGGDQRGRHTTTSRQLVPLPSGGSLVDMPGLRSLGTQASRQAVAAAFPEIEDLAARCRFADCSHDAEPDCAVNAAIAGGQLDPARFASYRKLMGEADRRVDPPAPANAARVWTKRPKAQRRLYRDREA